METIKQARATFNAKVKISCGQLTFGENDKSFDMSELCREGGLPEDDYKVVFTLALGEDHSIGMADFRVESKTVMTFYAAWHCGELKNFAGELGGWWGNEVVCLINPERMLVEDLVIPDNNYDMAIIMEKDER
jgi:hypothetical protein